MMSGTFVAAHISFLHASVIAHIHDPFLEFDSITVRACRLLSGCGEAHMVVHTLDMLEIVAISSNNELMEDPDENTEDDPKFELHQIDNDVEET